MESSERDDSVKLCALVGSVNVEERERTLRMGRQGRKVQSMVVNGFRV